MSREIMMKIAGSSVLGVALLAAVSAQAASLPQEVMQRAEALRRAWLAAGHAIPATADARVLSGKILTPTVDVQTAPGQIELSLNLAVGSTGISSIIINITSPSNTRNVFTDVPVPSYPVKPKLKLPILTGGFGLQGLNLYSEPGEWTINSLTLLLSSGGVVSYDAQQIASLFGNAATVQVTNDGAPDTTPPAYGSGKVLTPTVSLSAAAPIFAARLKASDSNSGVASFSLGYAAPGSNFPSGGAGTQLDAPEKSGEFTAYGTLPAGSSTGTYTINNFSVCDYAGNCSGSSDPGDIKKTFGTTTFQVTD